MQNKKLQTNNLETYKAKKFALQKKENQTKFVHGNLAKNLLPRKIHCCLKTKKKKNISQQCWKYLTKYIV